MLQNVDSDNILYKYGDVNLCAAKYKLADYKMLYFQNNNVWDDLEAIIY